MTKPMIRCHQYQLLDTPTHYVNAGLNETSQQLSGINNEFVCMLVCVDGLPCDITHWYVFVCFNLLVHYDDVSFFCLLEVCLWTLALSSSYSIGPSITSGCGIASGRGITIDSISGSSYLVRDLFCGFLHCAYRLHG